MLGKETIGHGDLERFHIGHRPRSLVGCCRRTGLPAIDAQFDQISVPGVAVVDPSLDHETTQPSWKIDHNANVFSVFAHKSLL